MSAPVDRDDGCPLAVLLTIPSLGLEGIGDRRGHDRVVRRLHTTELVNPGPYLRPGELVCTVGSALTGEAACRDFAAEVARAEAVGICFGVGDVHDAVPRALLDRCKHLGVPLVVAPFGTPFLAIEDVLAGFRRDHADSAKLGEMVQLIADRLASPRSLADQLARAGLGTQALVVAAWPVGTARALRSELGRALVATATSQTITVGEDVSAVLAFAARHTLPCGHSAAAPLGAFVESLSTARLALEASRRTGVVTGPGGLSTFGSLLAVQPSARMAVFADTLIAPLTAAAHQPCLETLREFIAHDLSVMKTARAQFLHPNTVRHRLGRVRQLTGRDPFRFEEMVALAIGLWAHDHPR